VLNLDPKDPLWVGRKRPGPDHPTGTDPKTRAKLKMDWSHGHNSTVHNGIGRIGFFSGGHAARWRDEDLADQWLERSNEWIENHVKQKNEKPFFLFFASHDCHVPRMPHERFHGKTKLGFRGDAIVQLDWCVGELIKTLKRLKLDNNTLVVFCSDNGPVLDDGKHKPAGPYRGGKYSIFEGGTRTPFITWLPGTIKPGVSDEIVTTTDLPACAAALTGQSLKGNECPDSFNVLDALLGKPGAKGRDHVISQDNRGGNLGYRHGDWKLLSFQNAKPMKRLTFEKKAGKYQLYNLASDPGERKNLFDKEPERARKMITELEKIRAANRTRP
jgi:arylsulfatase A